MENREVVEGGGQLGKHKVMMPHANIEGIPSAASVQATEAQSGPNQRMDGIPVFKMEKIQSLPKYIRLVIALDPEALLEVGSTNTPDQLAHTSVIRRNVMHV
jgi:hypothetical protein